MKKTCFLAGLMVLAAVLLVLPVGAKAEMYVEGYLGGVMAGSDGHQFTHTTTNGIVSRSFSSSVNGVFDGPNVVGGLKLGTWFVKEGFLGANYPDWMKYLGFYVDFSYHRLDYRRQEGTTQVSTTELGVGSTVNHLFSEGSAATLAFMFAFRYGFFPDSEVPFGRLQPYLAVGPAILFSSQQAKFGINSTNMSGGGVLFSRTWDGGSQSSVNIALAADAGIRYMALKNVSLDLFFKYRYAAPSYSYTVHDQYVGFTGGTFSLSPTLNLFSLNLGAAYHF